MPSPEPLMRIGDKGIVLRYSRCTMLAHIPYSDTEIPSHQAAVRKPTNRLIQGYQSDYCDGCKHCTYRYTATLIIGDGPSI